MAIWNLGKSSKSVLKPDIVTSHDSGIEDVQWSLKNTNVIGCACQDKSINM